MKRIHIVGGGTVFHVRPHLAISATAYGKTTKKIASECRKFFDNKVYKIVTHLTKMASGGKTSIETNEDVKKLLDEICQKPENKIIFLPVALCDFEGHIIENNEISKSGKNQARLISRSGNYTLQLTKADKLIGAIKTQRPDITLIGFKTTSNIAENETIALAEKLLVEANCDFVFANDIYERLNIIIGKNNYISVSFRDRNKAIEHLVELVATLS